ncbi:MAG: hypothetical protein ACLQJR_28505 [Stellaceae bacterium]
MNRSSPRDVRAALALTEQRRRERLRAAEQDHFERTRHSLIFDGHQLGHVKPTAQTQAKLRADPIVRLVANETLTREQGRAAVEIRGIYERVAAGLLARTSDPATRSTGTMPQMPERTALLHARRYLPWARYLAGSSIPERPASGGRCAAALEVAVDVIIEGRALGQCDGARRWRNGTAGKLLAYALAVYTDMAGWERNRDKIAAFEAWWGKRRETGRRSIPPAP